ncbi:DUF1345 domain-containing protein [Spirosoma rhododendri]|uniref:DUF1345 domain-containing protein n=2 Tax=Spirosoma rhododendri TaxID=2728024 RepID=A0A7L5DK77_9BACT|nr:DUF1345 domain-containing protein [Spirosoma rhododendri]QJD78864.1 DUF1345 domain-containing protein [Spirosoma rhododendri]
MSMLDRISRLNTSRRLVIAVAIAFITAFATSSSFSWPIRIAFTWVGFSLSTLLMMWVTITVAHPRDLPGLSKMEDSSRTLISLLVSLAATLSLFVVLMLLDSMTKSSPSWIIWLAVLSVACSWTLVHTVFTLRYAHLYYGDSTNPKKRPAGLDFPNEDEPDYLDFAYFSFVVGMTSQVSDVAVSSKSQRRTALLHGVLSFVFNAIIIALTISGVSGLMN